MKNIYIKEVPGLRGWLRRRLAKKHDKSLQYLLFSVIKALEEKPGEGADGVNVTNFLYHMHKELVKKGIDAKLPWYWGMNGPVIEMQTLKARLERSGYYMEVREGE
jgi:hypothetical protein